MFKSVLCERIVGKTAIKKTVAGGEKNETLPPSGIEPRMFSPGIVHSMHRAYWTHYLQAAHSVAWGNFL